MRARVPRVAKKKAPSAEGKVFFPTRWCVRQREIHAHTFEQQLSTCTSIMYLNERPLVTLSRHWVVVRELLVEDTEYACQQTPGLLKM